MTAAEDSIDSYLDLSSTDFFVAIKTYTVRTPWDPRNRWAAGISVGGDEKSFTAFWRRNYALVLEIPCDSQLVKNDSFSQVSHIERR
jgi:hypothetical protein